jgi:hypothetical protein
MDALFGIASALGGINTTGLGGSGSKSKKLTLDSEPPSKPPVFRAPPPSKPPVFSAPTPTPAPPPIKPPVFSAPTPTPTPPPTKSPFFSSPPSIKSGGLDGIKLSASKMLSGGMPCKFELLMEFFCSFLFTFIIYFCVFAFVPYDGIITKILKFIRDITKKFTDFLYTLVPAPVKKGASKLFPKFVVTFFKETLPDLLNKKKDEVMTPLKKKLQKLKDDTEKKLMSEKKKHTNNKDFLSKVTLYFNEKYLLIKSKLTELWEKFKDKIIPALVISFIYYIIWLIFLKLIPTILKYLISVAQQFKQP